MSSAILYAAIIAIWACFLVPAWLRRPHAHPGRPSTEAGDDADVSVEADIHAGVSEQEQAEAYAEEWPEYGPDYVVDQQFYGAPAAHPDAPRPSESRQQMLRARRRMLSILITIALVTFGFAYLGFVRWWICAPPAMMLVLYVLLLRTIAVADAEFARKRAAWERSQARAYAQYMRDQAEREAYDARAANSGADVIDISGRVCDQLYDQYADAAVRAVGD